VKSLAIASGAALVAFGWVLVLLSGDVGKTGFVVGSPWIGASPMIAALTLLIAGLTFFAGARRLTPRSELALAFFFALLPLVAAALLIIEVAPTVMHGVGV